MFDAIGGSGIGSLIAAALNMRSHVNRNKPKFTLNDLIELFLKGRSIIYKPRYELASIYSNLKNLSYKLSDSVYDGNGM